MPALGVLLLGGWILWFLVDPLFLGRVASMLFWEGGLLLLWGSVCPGRRALGVRS